jgi:hypothetical protein
MLFFDEIERAHCRQQARDLVAVNLGTAGGKDATKALRALQGD